MPRKNHPWLIALIIVMSILWLTTGRAAADIGPKPSVDFRFSYPPGQSLSVVSGNLLSCKDGDCLETTLYQMGPYGELACHSDACSGTLFSTDHPMRLQVVFTDNRTRVSNPFTASAMRNIYTVKVRDTDLVVSRNVILSNNSVWGLFLLFFPLTGFGLLLLAGGLLASNLFIEHRNRTDQLSFKAAPGWYLLAWVLAALVLVGGSFLTLSLPLTILIEIGAAYLYIRFHWPSLGTVLERYGDTVVFQEHSQNNRPPWLPLLTAIVTVNLITQPLLWAIASSLTGTLASAFSWPIILMEIGAWLVEAILLRIIQWRQIKWGDAAQLSFFMNLASYAIGLLLTL